MKAIKNQVTRLCCVFLILVCIFWAGCGKQTINGVALPEFYGLFAIDGGKLVQVKQGDFPNFSGDVTFLLFDKSVAFGADTTFYSIGFDTEPHPTDDGSFSWPKFMQAADAYQSASQAALTGIPQGAAPIETLKKPVPNKNEMLQFVPATPLKPGLYQLGNVAKFWVAREKYQSTVESNARQALQGEHWVDASRFATIALIIGLSNPSQADEFTQIKFGALSKGANKAIQQGDCDTAQSLAQRGNDLRPSFQYATEFRQQLNVEIPYARAIKIAEVANRNEDWDAVMRTGNLALNLKPNDTKAKDILAKCPKIPISVMEKIPSGYESHKIYTLQFSSDGKKLLAVLQWFANNGHPYSGKVFAWDVEKKSEINVLNGDIAGIPYFIMANGNTIAKRNTILGWSVGDLFFENLFDPDISKRSLSGINVQGFGFNEDGSILWTTIGDRAAPKESQLKNLGLLSSARELGLMESDLMGTSLKQSAILWDAATLKPITLLGTASHGDHVISKVLITPDKKTAIVYEVFQNGWGVKEQPDILAAWDIATHKLLATGEGKNGDFSVWEIAPDGKRVVVWTQGKFWHWNWETKTFESPVELPTQGNHITVFSPNRKYIADRSTSDPYIRICEFETGKVLCKFKEAPGVNVNSMAFSPDGSYLAVHLDRDTDYLALWKIPDDLKPSISKKLIFAVATPKEELATTSSNTANQQDSAQPASQTKTAQQTANNDISQTPFQKLTATVPNARLFAHHTREYSFAYDKVWDAVSSLLADQKDKIIQSDKNSGGLITDMTRHGIIGFPSYNKYCLLVEKESDASTKVTLKLLLYYMDFDGAHGPRNTLQPQNKDFTNGKAEGFLDKVGERLQKGK